MYFDLKNSVQSNSYSYEQISVDRSVKTDETTPSTGDTQNNSSNGNPITQNPTTVRALEAANLPINEKNIELVESMMREGLNIDKDSIQNMYRMLLKYPQIESSVLVTLKALDMEINDATIRQLESYANQNHQITEGLQIVSDGMWDMALDLFESGDNKSMQNALLLAGELLQGTDMPEKTIHFVKTAEELLALIDTFSEQGKEVHGGAVQGEAVQGEAVQREEVPGKVIQTAGGSGEIPKEQGFAHNPVNVEEKGFVDGLADSDRVLFMEKLHELTNHVIPAEERSALEQKLAEINANRALLREMQKLECILLGIQDTDELLIQNQNARNHDILLMNALGKGQENQPQLVSQTILNPQMLLENINAFFEMDGEMGGKDIPGFILDEEKLDGLQGQIKDFVKQAFFENKELMWQVKEQFSKQLLLKPEDVAQPKKVMELYENLSQKLNQMGKILSDIGMSHSQVAQPVVQMQENIQFMNQLNQVFQYVQIPLRMFEKDVCGELCVYTNKKHLAEADGNLSAFLHLDMDYMGPVDVYVSLKKGQHVSTNFYLQDEETLDFINAHISMLDERLKQKGYQVSTKAGIREQEEDTSVFNQMMNHKSLDVRTKLFSVNSFDTLI